MRFDRQARSTIHRKVHECYSELFERTVVGVIAYGKLIIIEEIICQGLSRAETCSRVMKLQRTCVGFLGHFSGIH